MNARSLSSRFPARQRIANWALREIPQQVPHGTRPARADRLRPRLCENVKRVSRRCDALNFWARKRKEVNVRASGSQRIDGRSRRTRVFTQPRPKTDVGRICGTSPAGWVAASSLLIDGAKSSGRIRCMSARQIKLRRWHHITIRCSSEPHRASRRSGGAPMLLSMNFLRPVGCKECRLVTWRRGHHSGVGRAQ